MKIYNQTAITNNNYQKNTVRKHNITPNFKATVNTKSFGKINIPDELKTNESITKYLNDNFGKVFSKEKIAQILAEVLTALGLANTVIENKNDNTITKEEKQKLDEYLKKYDFDRHNINKKVKNTVGFKEAPLVFACCIRDLEFAKLLLKHPDINVNMQNEYGFTALIWAASRGNTEIVKALLNHPNINVNMQDNYGFTALISAASRGNTEIVKALLEKPNIDVNMQSEYGFTALILAASHSNTEIVKALSENPNIDVNIQDNDGETALISAASSGYTEIVKALLENPNIDVNIQDNDGETAMDYMPEITQMKKEIDERKAKEVQEAKETIEAQK